MLVISRLRADCPFSDAQSISLPQPPPPSPHYPLVRIHQRTDPLIRHLASLQLVPLPQVGCRAQSRWLEIDVHVLPVSLVRLEDLMHEADIVMLLDGAIPPFDGFLVQRAVGVGVHVVEGAPVGDEDELSGGARVFGCIAGLAEDWQSVSTNKTSIVGDTHTRYLRRWFRDLRPCPTCTRSPWENPAQISQAGGCILPLEVELPLSPAPGPGIGPHGRRPVQLSCQGARPRGTGFSWDHR